MNELFKLGSNTVDDIKLGAQDVLAICLGSTPLWKRQEQQYIYGWHYDASTQTVTYLEDAVGKAPAGIINGEFTYGGWGEAFFLPKPCMLRYDGVVDYYLNPSDYTKKKDGTNSDVANLNYPGNAMMEWPLIWYKFTYGDDSTNGSGYFYCANYRVDNSYHCWCNTDCNGDTIKHFYTAIYNSITFKDEMRSISGVNLTRDLGSGNTDLDEDTARAFSNNMRSEPEWYIDYWNDRTLINALLILISKNTDSQSVFGQGMVNTTLANKETYTTGTLNDKGLFWGSTTDDTLPVKVFGMENWWGCMYRRTAGLVGKPNYLYGFTLGNGDNATLYYNDSGAGYIETPGNTGSGYFKRFHFSDVYGSNGNGTFFPVYISGETGPDTFLSGEGYALCGGGYSEGSGAGMLHLNLSLSEENSNLPNVSSCLTCKPVLNSLPKVKTEHYIIYLERIVHRAIITDNVVTTPAEVQIFSMYVDSYDNIPAYNAVQDRILLEGSVCTVIDSNEYYILDFNNNWVLNPNNMSALAREILGYY